MVSHFYYEIEQLPPVSDQEMGTFMQQLSIQQNNEFDTIAALKELYIYVSTYKEQVCFITIALISQFFYIIIFNRLWKH
jgi:hypothetical protein